jgi:hypothetical protein
MKHSALRLRALLPAALVVAWWAALWALGDLRGDHAWTGVIILALSYSGAIGRKLLPFFLPLLLTGVVYDSQRFYGDYIRGRIRVEEPYLFDKKFFGITTASGQVLTPNEWWQNHTHWFLDLVTGFYYLTFIAIYVGLSAWFYFRLSRTGTPKKPAAQVLHERPRLMWSFFWVNVLGYSTYYWYPAAPPWYVAAHGLGPAKLDTPASPAGCLRFDELLGTNFFTGMYGRAADVFGAIPSLHVAYPLLAVLFAFRLGALRGFALSFYLIMCFSAVYLNHHYVLDILWGSAYAVLIFVLINRLADRVLIFRTTSAS